MKTLEQHKAAYLEMVTTHPPNGSMRPVAEYLNSDKMDLLLHYVQSERDIRRLGLHRVGEAIDDLTKEELREFITFLSEQSKRRQEDDEGKLNTLIINAHTLAKDPEWVRSVAQLNKLRLSYSDHAARTTTPTCWCCDNRPIRYFDWSLLSAWLLFKVQLRFEWLGLTRVGELLKRLRLKQLEKQTEKGTVGVVVQMI